MRATWNPMYDRSELEPKPAMVIENMDAEAIAFIQNLMCTTSDANLKEIRAKAGAHLMHWDSAKGVAYIVMKGSDTFEFMLYFADQFMCPCLANKS